MSFVNFDKSKTIKRFDPKTRGLKYTSDAKNIIYFPTKSHMKNPNLQTDFNQDEHFFFKK